VDREDVRVLELGGERDLAQEAVAPKHRRQLRPQHLQGHGPVELQVLGEEDVRHPAPADLALHAVPVGEGCLGRARRSGIGPPWSASRGSTIGVGVGVGQRDGMNGIDGMIGMDRAVAMRWTGLIPQQIGDGLPPVLRHLARAAR
jgi:hypothetical protein